MIPNKQLGTYKLRTLLNVRNECYKSRSYNHIYTSFYEFDWGHSYLSRALFYPRLVNDGRRYIQQTSH